MLSACLFAYWLLYPDAADLMPRIAFLAGDLVNGEFGKRQIIFRCSGHEHVKVVDLSCIGGKVGASEVFIFAHICKAFAVDLIEREFQLLAGLVVFDNEIAVAFGGLLVDIRFDRIGELVLCERRRGLFTLGMLGGMFGRISGRVLIVVVASHR